MSEQDTRQRLESHLDQHPSDLTTRLVYADLLEQMGEDTPARGQRWQAAHDKWPRNPWGAPPPYPWVWSVVNGLVECEPHAWLPSDVVRAMGYHEWQSYRTRAEAEAALARALEEVS